MALDPFFNTGDGHPWDIPLPEDGTMFYYALGRWVDTNRRAISWPTSREHAYSMLAKYGQHGRFRPVIIFDSIVGVRRKVHAG